MAASRLMDEIDVATSLDDHFWARVDRRAEGCWLWTGATNGAGYPSLNIGSRTDASRGKFYAHRLAYIATNGPIPAELELDHLCRTTLCVRPDHLEAVTHQENLRRSRHRGLRTHCAGGHEFTVTNIYWRTKHDRRTGQVNTYRECRACIAAAQQRYRARKAAANTP